jgi:CheY-like chemotaxis protein
MMLSPASVERDAIRCRELGIADYCTKPVLESDLVKVLVKALETAMVGNTTPDSPLSPHEPKQTLRILLAESNEVTQLLVTHLLEKRGHQVFLAADGLEAFSAVQDAQARGFDLILVDTDMCGMNRLEAARAIREIERRTGGHMPIIAMTGNPSLSEEEACAGAGTDAYLAKPIRPIALFECVQRLTSPQATPATRQAPPSMVFDKDGFLSRLEGDEGLGKEIIEMFLQECPKLLQNVRQAAEQRNASMLFRSAHTLKGSIGDIAAPQALDAARTLEQMARKGELEGLETVMMSLEAAVQTLVRELGNHEKQVV